MCPSARGYQSHTLSSALPADPLTLSFAGGQLLSFMDRPHADGTRVKSINLHFIDEYLNIYDQASEQAGEMPSITFANTHDAFVAAGGDGAPVYPIPYTAWAYDKEVYEHLFETSRTTDDDPHNSVSQVRFYDRTGADTTNFLEVLQLWTDKCACKANALGSADDLYRQTCGVMINRQTDAPQCDAAHAIPRSPVTGPIGDGQTLSSFWPAAAIAQANAQTKLWFTSGTYVPFSRDDLTIHGNDGDSTKKFGQQRVRLRALAATLEQSRRGAPNLRGYLEAKWGSHSKAQRDFLEWRGV